jgi:hypothetical protein
VKRQLAVVMLLIGPVILEDGMTGQNYLEFLQNELSEQLEDVPLATGLLRTIISDL